MLTRDLLRFHRRNGRCRPDFIPGDKEILDFCDAVIGIYRGCHGQRKREIEPLVKAEINGSALNRKIAEGLVKVFEDRCVFSGIAGENEEFQELRSRMFDISAASLKKEDVTEAEHCAGAACGKDIYGDLPGCEKLSELPDFTPESLVSRYNTALAQSLIMYAGKILISLPDPDTGELRRLVKFMRFFRLLGEVTRNRKGETEIEVSGPFALFENSRRYALALAAFFPAVLNSDRWKIRAELHLPGRGSGDRALRLELSEADGLERIYRNLGKYIPEEIRMFAAEFSKHGGGWQISGGGGMNDNEGRLLFPDFTFTGTDGTEAHLELFHRFHSAAELRRRLNWIRKRPELKYLIGIDRSIGGENLIDELLREYPEAAGRIFPFRDFPGTARVLKMLKELE